MSFLELVAFETVKGPLGRPEGPERRKPSIHIRQPAFRPARLRQSANLFLEAIQTTQ
jgi:hypothetical protein